MPVEINRGKMRMFIFVPLLLGLLATGSSAFSPKKDESKASDTYRNKRVHFRNDNFLHYGEDRKMSFLNKHEEKKGEGHNKGKKKQQKRQQKEQQKEQQKKDKSFLHLTMDDEEENFYVLKLNEHNFRWSLPLSMGSEKEKIQLGIVTSTPITALYCSHNEEEREALEMEDMKKLKYDIQKSDDTRYIECKSTNCNDVSKNPTCAPLKDFFQKLEDYNIRKKNCKKKFCDYVSSMTFLNMNKLSDRNLSVCSFNTTIGNDQVKGFYFRDSFFLFDVINSYYTYFGCISESGDLKLNEVLSGVLGLARSINNTVGHSNKRTSIVDTFIFKSISKKKIFGLCFIQGGGFVSFGGYDESVLKKKALPSEIQINMTQLNAHALAEMKNGQSDNEYDIVWLSYSPTTKDIYSLFLKEVKAISGSKSITNAVNAEAIVDSYNYFLSLPLDVTAKIKQFIHDDCADNTNDCSKLIETGIMKLKNVDINKFPKIELVFKDGSVVIDPSDYIINEEDDVYRVLVNSAGVLKLGIPFLLNKYIIFDNEQNKLGVSRSACNPNEREEETSGMDLTLNYDDYAWLEDEQKHKTAIIALSVISAVGSITGSIFYFS
ncbi:aspartyl protease, putative [Plasmodium ovale]|uniref:Aspartyl protease, putative n=1 Tax=Plasmodium ovale TaxID=36330 RepID=A0A1C3L5N4_PLAOA|nr:aspartyl protease, putative [Plasmodium ovale]